MSDKELRTLILSKLSDKRNKRPHGTPQTGSKPASANTTPSSSFAITPSSSSQSLPVPFDVTDEVKSHILYLIHPLTLTRLSASRLLQIMSQTKIFDLLLSEVAVNTP